MKALDKTRILAPSDYFYHFSFPRYGRLKSKFLCKRYFHCIFSSCSIDLTKFRYTWSLTAVLHCITLSCVQPTDQSKNHPPTQVSWRNLTAKTKKNNHNSFEAHGVQTLLHIEYLSNPFLFAKSYLVTIIT